MFVNRQVFVKASDGAKSAPASTVISCTATQLQMDEVGTVVGTDGDVGTIRVGTMGTRKKVLVGIGVKVGLGVGVSVRGRTRVGVGEGIPVRLCWAAWVASAWDVWVAATKRGWISNVGAEGNRAGIASQEARRSMAIKQRYKLVRFIRDPLSNQGNSRYTDLELRNWEGFWGVVGGWNLPPTPPIPLNCVSPTDNTLVARKGKEALSSKRPLLHWKLFILLCRLSRQITSRMACHPQRAS